MTEKLFWKDPFGTTFEATVVAAFGDVVVLDRSLFYPEGGGQLGDRGVLTIDGRDVRVRDTQIDDDGTIRHLVEGTLSPGDRVHGSIDRERRRDHMSQHTGQHVLSRALLEIARAETVSARLGEGSCTIDTDKTGLEESAIARAEDLVNELILSDVPVRSHYPTPEELAAMPLRRAPKVSTGIRVIEVAGFDFTPCGGTHVASSGQIGPVRVLGVEKYKGGTRVSFAAGKRALQDAREKDAVLRELARSFTCGPGEVPAAIAKLRSELKSRTDAMAAARGELMQMLAERLLAAHPVDPLGTRIVVIREGDDLATLRALAGALARRPDVIAFVASRDGGEQLVVVERGAATSFDAGAWFKKHVVAAGGARGRTSGASRRSSATDRRPRGARTRMRIAVFALIMLGCSSPSEESVDPGDSAVAPVDAAIDTEVVAADTMATTDTATETAAETAADVGSDSSTTCGCTAYSDPSSLGAVGGTVLKEISGLAVSRAHPGVLWTHNDSGDSPRIFAIGEKGAFFGEVTVRNATAVDWEDIALGPCPTGTCVYVADIGDNGMSRTNLAVYRVPEPNVENKPFATITADATKLPFAYPDGRWNSEALLVHPTTGDIFVVTKGTTAGIYRFPKPLTPGTTATLVRLGAVAGLAGGVVTGGDVSPCGDRVLLRTYGALFEFAGADPGAALLSTAKKVPVASEPQGEAVAYRADGRGYFTVSEGGSVTLHGTSCK